MRYVSTRGTAPELPFHEAMLTGLARDGGLYVPAEVPTLSADEIRDLAGQPYEEIAFRVMRPFLGDSFTDEEFREDISAAYAGFAHPARAPLKQLAPNQFLAELFHGPTLAFKDFAMQPIGNIYEHFLKEDNKKINIIVATSGDTGSAAIAALKGKSNINVFVLHPDNKISNIQRKLMTTVDSKNVFKAMHVYLLF